jgi:hypothetical protein
MESERQVVGDHLVAAAVDVLDGFAVSGTAVVTHHGAELADDGPALPRAVEAALRGDGRRRIPAVFVRSAIAAGPRGIDAPGKYRNGALELQFSDVFGAIGARVEVTDAEGVPLDESAIAPEPYRIEITDAADRTHGISFSYPDTPLGKDNYPALVYVLRERLLAETGYTLVPLAAPDRRWRFGLVETDELERLRTTYGDRIVIGNHPVLAERPLDAYVPTGDGSDVVVPSWVDQTDDRTEEIEVTFPDDPDLPEAETDVDAVLDGVDPHDIAAGDVEELTDMATDGGVVAGDFDAFAADLSTVDPVEPAEPDTPTTAGTSDTGQASQDEVAMAFELEPESPIDPSEASTSDDPHPLDDVFDRMERDVVAEPADATGSEDVFEDAEDVLASDVFGEETDADEATSRDRSDDGQVGGDATGFEWVDPATLEART